MTPENWITIITIITQGILRVAIAGLLVYYVLKKKYKDDRHKKYGFWDGLWNLIDKRFVEGTLFAVLIPDWKLILEIIK